jgi:Uma2 family endonuclease
MILHLSQLDQQGSYTYSEYLKWRFDELVELIKGRLYPMSAPLSRHQRIVGSIYRDIATYLKRKKCQVFIAPFDVRLPRFDANGQLMEDVNTVVQPDICIICDPNKIDERGCNGVPDMIVEVLSPSTAKKDLNEKFNIYEEVGVKEYWVVFPDSKIVSVYLLENDKFVLLDHFEKTDTVKVNVLPDLVLSMEDIFENT